MSTMTFFDTTPIGRIINRFSKDIDEVDLMVPAHIKSRLIKKIIRKYVYHKIYIFRYLECPLVSIFMACPLYPVGSCCSTKQFHKFLFWVSWINLIQNGNDLKYMLYLTSVEARKTERAKSPRFYLGVCSGLIALSELLRFRCIAVFIPMDRT